MQPLIFCFSLLSVQWTNNNWTCRKVKPQIQLYMLAGILCLAAVNPTCMHSFLRGKCIWMSSKQWQTFKSIKLDLFDFWFEITVIKFLKKYKFLFRVTTSQQHYSCCAVARMAEERICCSVSTVLIKWLTFSCFVYFMQNYFAEMQVMTSCNLLGCLHIRIHENKRQRRKLCAP